MKNKKDKANRISKDGVITSVSAKALVKGKLIIYTYVRNLVKMNYR